jgi:hypothetical protein
MRLTERERAIMTSNELIRRDVLQVESGDISTPCLKKNPALQSNLTDDSRIGQSRHFGRRQTTSGLSLEADTVNSGRHISKVPIGDVAHPFRTRLEAV